MMLYIFLGACMIMSFVLFMNGLVRQDIVIARTGAGLLACSVLVILGFVYGWHVSGTMLCAGLLVATVWRYILYKKSKDNNAPDLHYHNQTWLWHTASFSALFGMINTMLWLGH